MKYRKVIDKDLDEFLRDENLTRMQLGDHEGPDPTDQIELYGENVGFNPSNMSWTTKDNSSFHCLLLTDGETVPEDSPFKETGYEEFSDGA